MKTQLLTLGIVLALSGCGGSDDDNAAPDNGGGGNPEDLIEQCENSGCTIDDAVTTSSLTVTNAPITLTDNASITLD
ncbi:hypothetical protein [Vibrio algivorus]|uniref:Uncharacterized protein n=1 Tax=Vibrio algivorus TaxID=1667024 RepID=A0A557P5F5_9VIBR|nr:hypothetical protein [Vibrio algivorus]TVO35895.1 hypothetical protein FOF44_10915 [Vibrio algivorus]